MRVHLLPVAPSFASLCLTCTLFCVHLPRCSFHQVEIFDLHSTHGTKITRDGATLVVGMYRGVAVSSWIDASTKRTCARASWYGD